MGQSKQRSHSQIAPIHIIGGGTIVTATLYSGGVTKVTRRRQGKEEREDWEVWKKDIE